MGWRRRRVREQVRRVEATAALRTAVRLAGEAVSAADAVGLAVGGGEHGGLLDPAWPIRGDPPTRSIILFAPRWSAPREREFYERPLALGLLYEISRMSHSSRLRLFQLARQRRSE